MKTFYVTFGQKYRFEDHPMWTNIKVAYVNPDGYWKVMAKDKDEAREKTFKTLGQYWSNLYEQEPSSEYYPLGVIGMIE